MTFPLGSQVYSGFGSLTTVKAPIFEDREPLSTDTNYVLGQQWVNQSSSDVFMLINFSTSGGVLSAVWTRTVAGGGGLTWLEVNSSSLTMIVNYGYVIDNGASLATLTLPSSAEVGDTFIIQGKSSGGWRVDVDTGQTINLGDTACTTSTGYLASTDQWDSVTITCVASDTTFACRGVQGNITIA